MAANGAKEEGVGFENNRSHQQWRRRKAEGTEGRMAKKSVMKENGYGIINNLAGDDAKKINIEENVQ